MLNKDEILKQTNSGLDVFKRYISGQWRVGRNFLNPLYEDRKASCNIYFDRRNDCYRLKDFGNDAYSGDCFDIVGKIKGLDCHNPKDFIEIMELINCELNLGLGGGLMPLVASGAPKPLREYHPCPALQPGPPKKIKPYSIVQQNFSERETAFWTQYGITLDILKSYKVLSLSEFKSENNEDKPFSLFSSDAEPIFMRLVSIRKLPTSRNI
jgi:hypothetical protein